MNYRHGFHAGNFADVLKHVVLTRILLHLNAKPTPYRIIDTHAGSGRYDLDSEEALRTHEWKDGVARIDRSPLSPAVEALLAPYRAALAGAAALWFETQPETVVAVTGTSGTTTVTKSSSTSTSRSSM